MGMIEMDEKGRRELSAKRALYRLLQAASKHWHTGCGFWMTDAERAERIEAITETECDACRAVRLYKAGDARKQVEFVRSVFGEINKPDSDEGRDLGVVLSWFDGDGKEEQAPATKRVLPWWVSQ